jgi:PAS domain S-box-containing protein
MAADDDAPFRALLENVDIVAVTLDRAGLVTFVNDYALALLGYHRDELLGASWFERCVPPEDRERVESGFVATVGAGTISARAETTIINRRGDQLRVRWANTVLRDAAGQVAGTASLGVELAERGEPVRRSRGRDVELAAAIEHDELRLFYQPIVSLQTGAPLGFEALARWEHLERGLLGPAEFIPRAEASGLIIELGTALLHQACRTLVEWCGLGGGAECAHISVNLSALQFEDPGLLATVDRILGDTGAEPTRLAFEITESVLLTDPDRAIAVMRELRERGIKISLDDFGTGYSSLSYLVRVPSDIIKLDRSFVSRLGTNPQNDQIVEAIISLARSLGKHVIAEGIETEPQKRELMALGCERGQGYLFARPLRVEDAATWVSSGRSTTRMSPLRGPRQ